MVAKVARAFQSMADMGQPFKKLDDFSFYLTILWVKMWLLCVFYARR